MDGTEYDVIIMGTGITESILSGLMSLEKKKVLHIDKNAYYGDSGASLNITSLWKHFRPNEEVPKELGANRDWNVDLIPKFIMSFGKLVKMIIKTDVTKYLSWKSVNGVFVYQNYKGGFFTKDEALIEKVPATAKEALSSNLMSLFEKNRCKNFMQYLEELDLKDPSSIKKKEKDPRGVTFGQFVKYWDLEENTIDFLGHAVALYTNEDFLQRPATEVVEKMQLYIESNGRFGNSPFIYPVYGLSGIPESFSRKCAVYGGTFMLNVSCQSLIYDQASGVSTFTGSFDGETGTAKAKMIIANPTYMALLGYGDRIKPVSKTIRCICIMNHPIPKTEKCDAVQIILPQKQTGRKNDIYIMQIGDVHGVCKKGYYLAIISTTAEKSVEEDLKIAFDVIGPVLYKFVSEEIVYESVDKTNKNNWFVTSSLDATSHFESAAENVVEIYKAITKNDLDLNIEKELKEQAMA